MIPYYLTIIFYDLDVVISVGDRDNDVHGQNNNISLDVNTIYKIKNPICIITRVSPI
jgi:hypothetical protein